MWHCLGRMLQAPLQQLLWSQLKPKTSAPGCAGRTGNLLYFPASGFMSCWTVVVLQNRKFHICRFPSLLLKHSLTMPGRRTSSYLNEQISLCWTLRCSISSPLYKKIMDERNISVFRRYQLFFSDYLNCKHFFGLVLLFLLFLLYWTFMQFTQD